MDFDKDNKAGDELEDYGDELASDYKEEAEERLGEEGDEPRSRQRGADD